MYNVTLKDREDVVLQFPDDMPTEEAKKVIQEKWYGKGSPGAFGGHPSGPGANELYASVGTTEDTATDTATATGQVEKQAPESFEEPEFAPGVIPFDYNIDPELEEEPEDEKDRSMAEALREGVTVGVDEMETPSPAQQDLRAKVTDPKTMPGAGGTKRSKQGDYLEQRRLEQGTTTVPEATKMGAKDVMRGVLGTIRSGIEVTPQPTGDDVLDPGIAGVEGEEVVDEIEKQREHMKPKGIVGEDTIPQQVARVGPQVATQVGASLAGGGYAGVSTIFSQIYGSNYEKARKEGKTPTEAAAPAFVNAGLQSGLEQIGIGRMLRGWTPSSEASKALGTLTKNVGMEWFTEFSQAFPQKMNELWIESENPDEFLTTLTDPEWLGEAAKEGAKEGLLTMPYAGAGTAVGAVKKGLAEDKVRQMREEIEGVSKEFEDNLAYAAEQEASKPAKDIDEPTAKALVTNLRQQEEVARKAGRLENAEKLANAKNKVLNRLAAKQHPDVKKEKAAKDKTTEETQMDVDEQLEMDEPSAERTPQAEMQEQLIKETQTDEEAGTDIIETKEGAPANIESLYEKGGTPNDIKVTGLDTLPIDVWETGQNLPADLGPLGNEFWNELATASKELSGNLARWAKLPEQVRGQFSWKPKHPRKSKDATVEVQDLGNIFTLAHETAHNIDWELTGKNIEDSPLAYRFPSFKGADMAKVRDELVRVSKTVRPKHWQDPSMQKYLNSAPELMADFGARYMMDPEGTRKIAPKTTQMYEYETSRYPKIHNVMTRLHDARRVGTDTPISQSLKNKLEIRQEETPSPEDIIGQPMLPEKGKSPYSPGTQAKRLALMNERALRSFEKRSKNQADEIDRLVPDKKRQRELITIVENAPKDWVTGKTYEQIEQELTPNELKAIKKYKSYAEYARQQVNQYIDKINQRRGKKARKMSQIDFLENYFAHFYETSGKDAEAQARKFVEGQWKKTTPHVKQRKYPTLHDAMEAGLRPRITTLSGGLQEWARVNFKVAANNMVLDELPQMGLVEKPSKRPDWPTRDYKELRRKYAQTIKDSQGKKVTLLQEGQVAVHPEAAPWIDAMFSKGINIEGLPGGIRGTLKTLSALNNVARNVALTTFSFFHHQAEFFSAVGALGTRATPFVGGFYGEMAKELGGERMLGIGPYHISILDAGKQIERDSEMVNDFLRHGGQIGRISNEGINAIQRGLEMTEVKIKDLSEKGILGKGVLAGYPAVRSYRAIYEFMQDTLWDNVTRAKLITYNKIVNDGLKKARGMSTDQIKEVAAEYVNNNFGGQEWKNQMFFKRKWAEQIGRHTFLSLDWTLSQIKNATWLRHAPTAMLINSGLKRRGIDPETAAKHLKGEIALKHWGRFAVGIGIVAASAQAAIKAAMKAGDADEEEEYEWFFWQNEVGHQTHIDWTPVYRRLPWNNGMIGESWQERGDVKRKYISLGKAGREIMRWFNKPLEEFYYKLGPMATQVLDQILDRSLGGDYEFPWTDADSRYESAFERGKHIVDMFMPISFSGGTAFLAFPRREGTSTYDVKTGFEAIFRSMAKDMEPNTLPPIPNIDWQLYNAVMNRGPRDLAQELISAAEKNGVNWKLAQKQALSKVRSNYYDAFAKAAWEKDTRKMREAARILLYLGAEDEDMVRSLQNRAKWKVPVRQMLENPDEKIDPRYKIR